MIRRLIVAAVAVPVVVQTVVSWWTATRVGVVSHDPIYKRGRQR